MMSLPSWARDRAFATLSALFKINFSLDLSQSRGGAFRSHYPLSPQLNRPHPQRAAHLEAGLEFAELARVALDKGMLRGFHENAFHAAEHLAKAELLSYSAALP
jgi:hypothetical protein